MDRGGRAGQLDLVDPQFRKQLPVAIGSPVLFLDLFLEDDNLLCTILLKHRCLNLGFGYQVLQPIADSPADDTP